MVLATDEWRNAFICACKHQKHHSAAPSAAGQEDGCLLKMRAFSGVRFPKRSQSLQQRARGENPTVITWKHQGKNVAPDMTAEETNTTTSDQRPNQNIRGKNSNHNI
jgi:hypothetical protein